MQLNTARERMGLVNMFFVRRVGAMARIVALGMSVFLVEMLWSDGSQAEDLILKLEPKITVGGINIEGSGRKGEHKAFLTASGHMYIKNGQYGFSNACRDKSKIIIKADKNKSKYQGQKIYFAVLLKEKGDLYYSKLNKVTFHIHGKKKGNVNFSDLQFSMKWEGEDGGNPIKGTTKSKSNKWRVHAFLSNRYNVPIVMFCEKSGCSSLAEHELKVKAHSIIGSGFEKETIKNCALGTGGGNGLGDVAKNIDNEKAEKSRTQAGRTTIKFTGDRHLTGWQIAYNQETKSVYDNNKCKWSETAPRNLDQKFQRKSKSPIIFEKPRYSQDGDRLCLYLRNSKGNGKYKWACVSKKYSNHKINISSHDLKATCPWDKKKPISIKIVRQDGAKIFKGEYKFLLPDGLPLAEKHKISHRKLMITNSNWKRDQRSKIKGNLKKHLGKYFQDVEMKHGSSSITATVGKAKYVDLAKLKVRFKYPGGDKYSKQCRANLFVIKDAWVRDPIGGAISLGKQGSSASEYYYKQKQTNKYFVWKRKGSITVKTSFSKGCRLRENKNHTFELSEIYEDSSFQAIIILKRRKPALIVVLEPINDQYFQTSINGRDKNITWQSDLEQVWDRVLGKDGLIKSILDEFPKGKKWSDVLFFRRSGGDYGDENRWHIDRNADLVNDLVENMTNSDNVLKYGSLIKKIRSKSPSSDIFMLIIGTPYKYKKAGAAGTCDRFDGQGGASDIKDEENIDAHLFELSFGNYKMLDKDICRIDVNKCYGINRIILDVNDAAGTDNALFKCVFNKEKQPKRQDSLIDKSAQNNGAKKIPLLIAKLPRAASNKYGSLAFKKIKTDITEKISKAFEAWDHKNKLHNNKGEK